MEPKTYDKKDSFQMNSIVKSLDVSKDNKIIMGLKNGEIKIKYYGTKTKHKQSIIRAHGEGEINDLIYIPEKKILSIGDDNKSSLFNLLSEFCESIGYTILSFPILGNIKGKCLSKSK